MTEPNSPRIGSRPPSHAGAAAEGHHGDAVVGAIGQHGRDLVLVGGQQHGVQGVLVSLLAPQQVRCGLAAGIEQARAVAGAQVVVADDRGQPVAVDVGERRGWLPGDARARDRGGRHAEGLFEQSADAVGERFGGVRIAPGVPRHRRKQAVGCIVVSHALQYYICCQSVTMSRWISPTGFLAAALPTACGTSASSGSHSPRSPGEPGSAGRPSTGAGPTPSRSGRCPHRSGHRRVAGHPGQAAGKGEPGRPDRGGRPAAARGRVDRFGAA